MKIRPPRLHDLIAGSAEHGIALQDEEGRLPGGHNGPWNNRETCVRTTAHWALLFYDAFQHTGDGRFLDAAIRACDYLAGEKTRPQGFSFYCMDTRDGRFMSNALIGQAWAIEPLIMIGAGTGNKQYLDTAASVITMHPYDPDRHGWHTIDVDGSMLGEDTSLNHQVWMAAMGIMLGKLGSYDRLLRTSLDLCAHLCEKAVLLGDGLIGQMVRPRNRWTVAKETVNRMLAWQSLASVSRGYLSFLLYGIALAYEHSREESLWEDGGLRQVIGDAMAYVEDNYPYGFLESANSFRWSYNPTGIEMAYVLQTLHAYTGMGDAASCEESMRKWLNKQLQGYYDVHTGLLNRNTADPQVLAARLYEATRIKDMESYLHSSLFRQSFD